MQPNSYYYLGQNPTVDLFIINHLNEVLLVRRKDNVQACPGMWAFPGGFIDTKAKRNELWEAGLESPENAAKREVKEETNLDLKNVIVLPVGIYEGNNRDPRDNVTSWSKSHAFFYELDAQTFEENKDKIKGLDDVDSAEWIPVSEVLKMDLAFDHKIIFMDCLKQYKPELLIPIKSPKETFLDNVKASYNKTSVIHSKIKF